MTISDASRTKRRRGADPISIQLKEVLHEAGLSSLSDADRVELSETFWKELQMRVGRAFAPRVSQAQLNALGCLIANGENDKAEAWLMKHCPDHLRIVQFELKSMKDELKLKAPQILDATDMCCEDARVVTDSERTT